MRIKVMNFEQPFPLNYLNTGIQDKTEHIAEKTMQNTTANQTIITAQKSHSYSTLFVSLLHNVKRLYQRSIDPPSFS